MPNNYLSVLYKHIIQVENENVGLKVEGGHKHTIAPNQKRRGHMSPLPPPPPPPLPTPVIYIYICVCVYSKAFVILELKGSTKIDRTDGLPNLEQTVYPNSVRESQV